MTESDYRLPLDHPLWGKLYGPYGVENTVEILTELLVRWDADIARDLFWEKLHHQETLYPVTYAAVPWLYEIALKHQDAREEIAIFLGWVVFCGMRPRVVDEFSQKSGMLHGLPSKIEELHPSWIPDPQKVVENDLIYIAKIEVAFMEIIPKIKGMISTQLRRMAGEGENVFHVATGMAAIVADFNLAALLNQHYDRVGVVYCDNCEAHHEYELKDGRICLAGGWLMDRLLPDETRGGAAVIIEVVPKNSILAEFLCAISGWTVCTECEKPMRN